MRLAIVAGGWHWPMHFFEKMSQAAPGADLFVIAHRSPELRIVREEKREILARLAGPLGALDRELYSLIPSIHRLRALNWSYTEEPNTVGDWGFFNQWLARHDFRKYDVILNCHDDTYVRRDGVTDQLSGDWLLLANGRYPEAPDGYVRGSFEFWKPELLEALGGVIDLGALGLTREGMTDTPADSAALSAWNDTAVPLRRFMVSRGMQDRIRYLSPFYRVSPWIIEGERGFIHSRIGAPWSFDAGLRQFPVEVLC